MKAWLIAATVTAIAAGALAPAARADGPRASSGTNWPGMSEAAPAVATPPAATEGPRASSANNWAGMSAPTAPYQTAGVAPHYVWQEGYDHKGKWAGHWVLVQ